MAYHINITTVSRVALGQGHGVAILQWLEVSVPTHLEFDASNLEKYRASTIYIYITMYILYHIFQHVNKHAHSNKIQESSHLHQPSTISTYTNHLN